MKNSYYILFLLLFLSCESKIKYEKPKNLIPKRQMIDLLYDMHIANGTSGIQNKNLERNINYMTFIYQKYNIDSIQFASSNQYYTANISEYEEIFKEVEKRLKVLQEYYVKERDSLIERALDSSKFRSPLKKLKLIDSLKR
jgi:hypothetical protein